MDVTVERLAEVTGTRVEELEGLAHRVWVRMPDGRLHVTVPAGLVGRERADQVASSLLEWWVDAWGWDRVFYRLAETVEMARRALPS